MSDRNKRFPVNFPVVYRHGPEMYAATLCNISISGGCIMVAHSLSKGDLVMLDYSVGQTRATVMWTMERMVGLRFESDLSAFGLNAIRAIKEPA